MTESRYLLPADSAQVLARHRAVLVATARQRVLALFWTAATLAFTAFAVWWLGIAFDRIGSGLAQLGKLVAQMFPPSTGSHLALLLHAMGETLAIAFLGTLTAAIIAFPLSFLAARNITPGMVIHFFARRCFDTTRGIDVLIWALVFVGVVGLGPFAGILAIAVSDAGAFGKLFSETIETADRKPIDGVLSAGGTSLHAIRFALVPQILPVVISQVLYYFESNVRSGHHHRHRGCGRHRPAALRADSYLRFRSGRLRDHHDPDHRSGNRLDVRQAPIRRDRPQRGAGMSRAILIKYDPPDTETWSDGSEPARVENRCARR